MRASSRFNRMLEYMSKTGLEYIILFAKENIYYFTGVMSYNPNFNAILLIKSDGKKYLIIDDRFSGMVKFQGDIYTFKGYDLNTTMITYPNEIAKVLDSLVAELDLNEKKVGIDGWYSPIVYFDTLKKYVTYIEDISGILLELRQIKDEDEINLIKQAIERLRYVYETVPNILSEGISEIELYSELNKRFLLKYGVEEIGYKPSLYGDCVSGERASMIGGPPTTKRINRGEPVILDLALEYKWYWADLARTYIVGKPSDITEKVFNDILEIKKDIEGYLREGVKANEIFNFISNALENRGYGKLKHHAGHGVGLKVWERPFLIPGSDEVLKSGNVITVEFGVYEKNIGGIRIEDIYRITANGAIKLSDFKLKF